MADEAPRLLDVRGLICPLPVLKARKALALLPHGARLIVLATDPRAPGDLAELCAAAGHRLVGESREADGVFRLEVERA